MKAFERVEAESRDALHCWLAAHHGQTESVWLVTFKKAAGERYLPYEAIVEEALAFGWIDSLPRRLDVERSMRLLSPRKPGSAWSKVNKERVLTLIANGRMQRPGLAKIEAAKADGSWMRIDAAETLRVPDDLAVALGRGSTADDNFRAFPPSTKRAILEWIAGARTPATRAKRIAESAAGAANNIRANQHRQVKSGRPPRRRSS